MINIATPLEDEEKQEFQRFNHDRFLPYLRICLGLFLLESFIQSVYIYLTAEAFSLFNFYNIYTAHFVILLLLTFAPVIKKHSNILASFSIVSTTFLYGALQNALEIPFEYFWISFFIPLFFIPLIPSFKIAFATVWLSLWLTHEFATSSSLYENSSVWVISTIMYFGIIVIVISYLIYNYRVNSFLLNKELAEAKLKADAASEAKSKFLATMSHEVRTPLNGILGIVEIMKDAKLSEVQKDYVETIKYSGEALLAILNDILDYSKIEAGKFQFEYVDFSIERLTHSVTMLMRSRAEEKGLEIKYQLDPELPTYLNSDPTRLRQILLNLIGNAIKFTDKGSIEISAKKVRVRGSNNMFLRFEVKDTGIGLTEQEIENLFQEFSQADSSISRKYGGTGLGLAISKNIAELMGGTIGVESQKGEGSTFWFRIPVNEAHATDSADTTDNTATNTAPANILVVEDHHINQQILVAFLEKFQHRITIANNGQEAIDTIKASQEPFDIILMDMQMPVMDGLSATKLIRKLKNSQKTPIIALSANILKEDRDKCSQAGMNDFLAKPIDPANLFKIIRAYTSNGDVNPAHKNKQLPQAYENLKKIEKIMGTQYLKDFINDSLKEIDRLVSDLKTNDDHYTIETAAHNLKHFAEMLGLDDISALVKSLEMSSKDKDEDQSSYLISKITRSFDLETTRQQINRHYFEQ